MGSCFLSEGGGKSRIDKEKDYYSAGDLAEILHSSVDCGQDTTVSL